ncbi:chloride channel protein [Chryseobacterium carnipullorum]|uniref:Chloride channel protein n=1 Tax=Chryseobacterium carnipullorum TaxID=1124835 RepID=A0A1M7IEA8_CHRCU|nr:chloride channel protein [Chryseobacterium carnipullorum]MDN5476647.1 chloride channel protein [Chryseobacterium sp.]AZA50136.1 chloride channel protein [Chryseobacterium carnipullorum]AZA65012.1 chloride channel protein [Chryseobacterium carnipullorum]SHM39094.1 chloride channel protein, CIC family [Chryseobacterium carnipullorum]STC97327.1 Voltage-gated ClC-type chloride channel ClcB [Chryseobacterium carnipullorum]
MKIHNKKKYLSFLKFKRDFQEYGLEKARSYELILHWLNNRLSRNQFLVLSGILVGCTAGLAGVILKTLVHTIHNFITHIHFEYQILFYIVFPFLGIVLTTGIVITLFKGQDRKGIGAILYEIAQNSSIVASVKMYSQVIQSAVTVGLGGSAGLESPIAVTGAAIGSNYAQTYRLSYKERTLLLAAGATAGIASAFNAPIAGIMFAFEILLTGVVFTDFIPLVVAAVCGSLLSRILLQEDILFRFYTREPFNYKNVPYYLILGIVTGLYARYFVVISQKVEHFIKGLKLSRMRKAMFGGLVLSLLCVLFPPLFGEGYETVKAFTNGSTHSIIRNSFFRYFEIGDWTIIIFLVLVCLLKAFATSFTIFSGGNGGNFAPSLFAGGTVGYLFALVCQHIGFTDVPVTNLVLVGMAGAMSGVLYAPLTAIFLIAESSFGYDLFIPLMIVSIISYLIAKWFSPISPELKSLADQGKIFTNKHDKNLLFALRTEDFIDQYSETINENASVTELFELVKNGNKNIFAAVDEAGKLKGILTLDDIRPYLFNKEMDHLQTVAQIMKAPPAVIYPENQPLEILQIFDDTGVWNLPVTNEYNDFVGFISKSSILMSYRQLLKEYSD